MSVTVVTIPKLNVFFSVYKADTNPSTEEYKKITGAQVTFSSIVGPSI